MKASPVLVFALIALLLTACMVPLDVLSPEPTESPESAYYRGFLSSCIGIGLKQGVPRDTVSSVCAHYMADAYENDFYNELMPDSWVWPPPKSDAAP